MEGNFFSISLSSILEDVLKELQGIKRLSDTELASRKAGEAAARRHEAAGWLRKIVGSAGANDLPEKPTEEEFRLGLRSGFILCTALNKVHPGAVTKVVVSSTDSMVSSDAAALSAYQYFENVRNFFVAVEEIGLPTFDTSDFEQGGQTSRIVNCILALKSHSEGKKTGGISSWKFGATVKAAVSGNAFLRKNSNSFWNSSARTRSQIGGDSYNTEKKSKFESQEMTSCSSLVRALLSDKKPEEVPTLVESLLNKVVEEFECRIARQNEVKFVSSKPFSKHKVLISPETAVTFEMNENIEDTMCTISKEESFHNNHKNAEGSKYKLLKQCLIIDQQQRHIQELRCNIQTTRACMEVMQRKCSEEMKIIGKYVSNLANISSSYHEVLEENRKLYNEVQDLKGSIRVYCRVRPSITSKFSNDTIGCFDERNITINAPSKYGKDCRKTFTFNKVFGPSASQEEIFADTKPLIRSVLDGYNVCIFAYGQTGSGKTYTMTGPHKFNQHNMGVNFRALEDLFNLAEQRRGMFAYKISVQMIEIYNEQVRDLLVSDGSNKRVGIRNSFQNKVNVPDANLFPVSSTADVIELMNIGQRNRTVGATTLNDRSSRSHSCLTIHVQGKNLTSKNILHGCMHLVDLAGSERVDKSEALGERLREAQHINKSLSALGDVISALAHKSSHIPYRNSKLTQLLQDSLGGQAKTLMFVHISLDIDSIGESISTLKFAERVSTVELATARLNKESAEIIELKEKLARHKATVSRRGKDSDYLQFMTPTLNASKTNLRSSYLAYLNRRYQDDVLSYESSNHKQPMEEVHDVEVNQRSALIQKRLSVDLQELLMAEHSDVWPDSSSSMNIYHENGKEFSSANLVDEVITDKQYEGRSIADWVDGDEATVHDFLYQKYVSDGAEVLQVQQYGGAGNKKNDNIGLEMHRHQFDFSIPTDVSDDLDFVTSDSSETDALWQFNTFSKAAAVAAASACTKNKNEFVIRKPQIKSVISPDLRIPIQSHIPSPPSRKTPSETSRTLSKQMIMSGMNGKRASSVGKMRAVQ